ncbi:MAG: hypothetical protein ACTH2U_12310 [Brevibacterium sp.]
MKKLILAPAVALAFTGLVAAPVAAAETPSTQSAQTKAEQAKAEKREAAEKAEAKKKADAKKEAAEKAAAKKAADKKAADKKAAAKKAADKKAADKKAADDKAAKDKKDGKTDESKKTPPPADNTKPTTPPKDNDDEGSDSKDENKGDEVKDINASLKVAASSVDAEQLADEGVKVTVSGLEKGDKLTTSGLSAPATTASGSTATLVVNYDGSAENLKDGKKAFNVKVSRDGATAKTLSGGFTILSDDEEVDPIESELSVDPETISAEDLANKDKGIQVTATNLQAGDVVTDSLTGKKKTVDENGDFAFSVYYEGDPENLEPGKQQLTVTVDREGTESADLKGEFTIGDEDPVIDPKVKLGTDEITVEEFKKNGLPFTGTGFSPGSTVSVTGKAVSAQAAKAQADDEVVADEEGNVSGVVTAPASLEAGTIELTFTDTDSTQSAPAVTITVTDDDAVDPIDASLKVDPKEITAEDLANKDKGVTVTVSGVKKGDKVTDSLTGKSETADADGDYKLHLWYEGNPKNLEEGKLPFTVTIDREGTESQTLDGAINVVADEPEAPAEATLKVSPKSIEAADFANDKKGVTLSVENCEPGADVHFEVNPKGINVTAYENTVKADDEGRASVNVFGTSSNASAYVGAYTATATCGDDTMKDSFKVTEGANGGGDNGNGSGSGDNGNDGSELPRTGADLGGLATGALLLLVGGAAIAVTGRRNKFARTPFSF